MHKFKDLVLAFLSAQLGIISLLLFPKRVCRIFDLLNWNRGANWAEAVKFTFHRRGSATLCRSWNGKILFSLLVVLWDGFKPLSTKQYITHNLCVCACMYMYTCVYREQGLLYALCYKYHPPRCFLKERWPFLLKAPCLRTACMKVITHIWPHEPHTFHSSPGAPIWQVK